MSEFTSLCFIHGVAVGRDETQHDTAAVLQKRLQELLDASTGAPKETLAVHAAVWATLAKSYQPQLEQEYPTLLRGSILTKLFENVVDYAADVLAYQGIRKLTILSRVESQIKAQRDLSTYPLAIYAHSLGSVILTDLITRWLELGYFRSTPITQWPFRRILTTGSPLGMQLPSLGFGVDSIGFTDRVARLKSALARDSVQAAIVQRGLQWTNMYDADDPVVVLQGTGPFRGLRSAGYPLVSVEQEVSTGFSVIGHGNYHGNAAILRVLLAMLSAKGLK